MKLSQSRRRVQAALIAAGVQSDRIPTVAYGEERPIGDNNTAKEEEVTEEFNSL